MPLETDQAFAELGLTPEATEAEVKAAWRRLVSEWHPDRNASQAAVERMQRINRAFKAIRHAGFASRQAAAAAPAPTPQRPRPHAQGDADNEKPSRDGTSDARSDRPNHIARRRLRLTLEEAALGVTRRLRGKISPVCRQCDGIGHRILGGHCPTCQGSGAIFQRSWFGWVSGRTECEDCHGGGIARQVCADCDGTGSETLEYELRVRLPPGVRDGDRLHVDGSSQKSGNAVDLDLRIELIDHELLRLDTDGTIRCEMPVDGFAWIANRTVQVPTLDGARTLQLDRRRLDYRMPGHGFPVERRGARADQLVTIDPIFPATLDTDQQILLDQLIATTSGADGRPVDERLRRWSDALRSGARA